MSTSAEVQMQSKLWLVELAKFLTSHLKKIKNKQNCDTINMRQTVAKETEGQAACSQQLKVNRKIESCFVGLYRFVFGTFAATVCDKMIHLLCAVSSLCISKSTNSNTMCTPLTVAAKMLSWFKLVSQEEAGDFLFLFWGFAAVTVVAAGKQEHL